MDKKRARNSQSSHLTLEYLNKLVEMRREFIEGMCAELDGSMKMSGTEIRNKYEQGPDQYGSMHR